MRWLHSRAWSRRHERLGSAFILVAVPILAAIMGLGIPALIAFSDTGSGKAQDVKDISTLPGRSSGIPALRWGSSLAPASCGSGCLWLPLVLRPLVETRAVWLTRFEWNCTSPCPDTLNRYVDNIHAGHFNVIMFQVRGVGDAFYTPGLEPWSDRLGCLGCDPGWDPLQTVIIRAHSYGIKVYAYMNQFPTWNSNAAPPDGTLPLHPYWTWTNSSGSNWQIWSASGPAGCYPANSPSCYLWASPADPDVQQHLIDVANDILSRYDVDGLHMDLIRYPDQQFSYDPYTVAHCSNGWCGSMSQSDWQRQQVTNLVSSMYNQVVVPKNRSLVLSAAVWMVYQAAPSACGITSNGFHQFYQDARGWLQQGIIDINFPMIYGGIFNTSHDCWVGLMQDHVDHAYGRFVVPGIDGANLTWDEINSRIAAARAEQDRVGMPRGVAIFSYSGIEDSNYWQDFATGPFAQPAVPAAPSWHP